MEQQTGVTLSADQVAQLGTRKGEGFHKQVEQVAQMLHAMVGAQDGGGLGVCEAP